MLFSHLILIEFNLEVTFKPGQINSSVWHTLSHYYNKLILKTLLAISKTQ